MDAESTALFELDNTPQALLIEARSKLHKQQSQELLSAKALHTPTVEAEKPAKERDASPSSGEATDSAYASSPELEPPRPTTAPSAARPPTIGALGIFPSSSMTSLPSMVAVEQDRRSDKESTRSNSVTALPTVLSPKLGTDGAAKVGSSSAPKEPSRLRHGSVPNVMPALKKRGSLSALKKYFLRRRH